MARASFTAPLTMFSSAKNGESVINLCEAGQSHYWHFIGHHLQESSMMCQMWSWSCAVWKKVWFGFDCGSVKGILTWTLTASGIHYHLVRSSPSLNLSWLVVLNVVSPILSLFCGKHFDLIMIPQKAVWFDQCPLKIGLILWLCRGKQSDLIVTILCTETPESRLIWSWSCSKHSKQSDLVIIL